MISWIHQKKPTLNLLKSNGLRQNIWQSIHFKKNCKFYCKYLFWLYFRCYYSENCQQSMCDLNQLLVLSDGNHNLCEISTNFRNHVLCTFYPVVIHHKYHGANVLYKIKHFTRIIIGEIALCLHAASKQCISLNCLFIFILFFVFSMYSFYSFFCCNNSKIYTRFHIVSNDFVIMCYCNHNDFIMQIN